MRAERLLLEILMTKSSISGEGMKNMTNNNVVQKKPRVVCGAKTRPGHPCKTPPVTGRKRCRMHGGTNNGAPKGSQNALKHGYYTRENIKARSEMHKAALEYKKICKTLVYS
jgi:hypothetical protein